MDCFFWLHYRASDEASFFTGSMMEPETKPDWLHYEAKVALSWSQKRGRIFLSGSMVRPEMRPETEPDWLHHEATTALSGSMVEPNLIYIYSTLLNTACIKIGMVANSKVKYFYLISCLALLTQTFMFSIMEVMKAESISGERRCDHGVRNNNGTDKING